VQLALESVPGRINDLGFQALTQPEKTFHWAWTLEMGRGAYYRWKRALACPIR
jgi:hypothetical protein